MNTTTRSTSSLLIAALAGGVVFGLAMAFRESAESIWVRAAVAAVGVGVAVVIRLARKQPGA